jgi:signal transduction histidine kinase
VRSLVGLTLLLVGGVVLLLGAAVVAWVSSEDAASSREDAARQHEAAETELRALTEDLVAGAQEIALGLVEGADQRLRLWIAMEPLSLYRDPRPPHAPDLEALRGGLAAEVRGRSLEEFEHAEIVTETMGDRAQTRIDDVATRLRTDAGVSAESAATDRRDRLVLRLGLLLLGMAALLAGTLYLLVVAPVRRLRRSVDRIADGDLSTPLDQTGWPTREMAALADDVERMRGRIAQATDHLESEVARKTRTLEATLDERTRALEELEATRDRLVQAEKMAGLGTLAGGVAHEFNNLLGGILGCLESARAGTDDDAVREDLDMARRTARRATHLVDALLGVARPGTRAFEPVRLARVVEDVLAAAEPDVRRRGIDLRSDLDASVEVEGDEGQLNQVVLNLVTNALQAVDDGEVVAVTLVSGDRHAVLEVRDSGPGIPAEDRSRVFEPFFTGRADGTGLGLFLSYGIIERHGGRIEVGDAPEGGARLTVRIPIRS